MIFLTISILIYLNFIPNVVLVPTVSYTETFKEVINHTPTVVQTYDLEFHASQERVREPPQVETVNLNICNPSANFLSYESHTGITDRSSAQWYYRNNAYTSEYGIRKYNDKWLVATSLHYGVVGDELTLVFDNGNEINVIVGDSKGSICSHNPNTSSASSFEFIVDYSSTDFTRETRLKGSFNHIFGNKIIEVRKEVA